MQIRMKIKDIVEVKEKGKQHESHEKHVQRDISNVEREREGKEEAEKS